MNIKFVLVLLLLNALINCSNFSKQSHLKIRKRQLKKFFLQAVSKCPKGSHWVEQDKRNNVVYGQCKKNQKECNEYDSTSGDCKECDWGYTLYKDAIQGNYCSTAWWYMLAVIFFVIAGMIILCPVLIYLCRCCCTELSRSHYYGNHGGFHTDNYGSQYNSHGGYHNSHSSLGGFHNHDRDSFTSNNMYVERNSRYHMDPQQSYMGPEIGYDRPVQGYNQRILDYSPPIQTAFQPNRVSNTQSTLNQWM